MLPIANSTSHLLGKCRCLTRAENETNSGSEERFKTHFSNALYLLSGRRLRCRRLSQACSIKRY